MIKIRGFFQNYRTPVLWVIIACYTWMLPQAIIIYRDLEARFGQEMVGKIPLISVIIIGMMYLIYGYQRNNDFGHFLYLIPSALIALTIIKSEPNPNKHIHIPQYILMAWLLYAVFSKEYEGKGIFLLIWICGSMLGVIDELHQGIHPKRFYGWVDMSINSASTMIGILTIMGLTKFNHRDPLRSWGWTKNYRRFGGYLGLLAFGFAGAVFLCYFLFDVQSAETFNGIYPQWLLGWHALFLILTVGKLIQEFRHSKIVTFKTDVNRPSTIRFWIFPPLTILVYMHLLVILVSLAGIAFR